MRTTFAAMAALAIIATPALAQDLPPAVKARQGQFIIMEFNLGILGNMARGITEYDAETAQAAADSIVAITTLDQPNLWPEGTDMMSIDGTRAEPAIWDNLDEVQSNWAALGEAATAMAEAAGTGREALGPNLGALGKACQNCHDNYRAPE